MLWYDTNGQIVADSGSVIGMPGLTALDAPSPGPNLADYYIANGTVATKTALTLTATTNAITVSPQTSSTIATPATETLTFYVSDGTSTVSQSVAPVAGTCTFTFSTNLAGTYTISAIGQTSISNTVTVTAS